MTSRDKWTSLSSLVLLWYKVVRSNAEVTTPNHYTRDNVVARGTRSTVADCYKKFNGVTFI